MAFNENTRVKIPAILHLCRLGYQYISLSKAKWEISTNIFIDIFAESLIRINKDLEVLKRNIENRPALFLLKEIFSDFVLFNKRAVRISFFRPGRYSFPSCGQSKTERNIELPLVVISPQGTACPHGEAPAA